LDLFHGSGNDYLEGEFREFKPGQRKHPRYTFPWNVDDRNQKVELRFFMTCVIKRRVARLLIGLLVFSQASIAFAACSMDRGAMAQAMTSDDACADCASAPGGAAPIRNVCLAHCTSDLQLAGIAIALAAAPADLPVLMVARPELRSTPRTGLSTPPSGAPPHRILLHSFLI
jgi:hypothetical protein